MSKKSLVAGMTLLGLLWILAVTGCTERVQTSTEVENEISARVVQGSAMDSVALDSSNWTAWDGTGAMVASGVTDSVGHFASSLSRAPTGGILVRVIGKDDTLWALSPLDTAVVRARVATVLVHGLTDAALPFAIVDPTRGFPDSLANRSARLGQKILDSVMGVRLPWSELAWDPNFRAVAPQRGGSPTPLAGFLRAMSVRTAREGQNEQNWIATLESNPGPVVAKDSLFGIDLAGSMAVLRLPQAQTTAFVQRLDEASQHVGSFENTWKNKQIFPEPEKLQERIYWAVLPKYQGLWERLVQITGDQAADYENHLPVQVRPMVQPGRSHELLAEAVGGLILPDSIWSPINQAASDTLLARLVPQAKLLLDQFKADFWGKPPQPKDSAGVPMPPLPDPLPKALSIALASCFTPRFDYISYQNQTNLPAWFNTNFHPLSTPLEASNLLRSVFVQHPELGLSSDQLR